MIIYRKKITFISIKKIREQKILKIELESLKPHKVFYFNILKITNSFVLYEFLLCLFLFIKTVYVQQPNSNVFFKSEIKSELYNSKSNHYFMFANIFF